MNEANYDKSLNEFTEGFEKSNKEDLTIKGEFSNFNNFKDLINIIPSEFENIYISTKNTIGKNSFSIKIELNNDVIGNKPYY